MNFDFNGTVKIPQIETFRHWTPDDVRAACIRNDLYTRGTNQEYMRMLSFVGVAAGGPTKNNMYLVAKDICEHSDDQTISNVMFILERETVITTFEIDGRDDI